MSYIEIKKHYELCFDKFGDTHLGVDWPNFKDTQVRHSVMFDVNEYNINKEDNFSILDFGCGLGHFYEWIILNQKNHTVYSGLDISDKFINVCKNKFEKVNFYCKDVLIDDNIPNFDYIICNGTFTEKRDLNQKEMMNFFQSVIKVLWQKSNKGIAFNLMSKQVDWEVDYLFHVSLDELAWFLKKTLSRNFIIRNDYKLYEYTVYVYK